MQREILSTLGGERKVVLADGDVPFDLFENQITRTKGSGPSLIKIIYFLKCEVICRFVPTCFRMRI